MDELYKKYARLVYSYLHSLCKSCDTAEELTQETFYKAVKRIDSFKYDCKVSTWLCRIAKNTWIDFLRKEKNQRNISIDDKEYIEKLVFDKSLENSVEDKAEIISLYQNIHRLDEDTREVFYLRLRSEFSFKEIGEILGRTENWARTVFYRGKIKLLEVMKDDEE